MLFPFTVFSAEATSICLVLSDSQNLPDPSKERYLQIKYWSGGSKSYFESLKLIVRDHESGLENIEELFTQTKRGGYDFNYCHSEEREYLEVIEKFNWHSTCTGMKPFREIRGLVSLSKRKDGIVKVTAVREDFSSEKREIKTGPCD